MTRKERYAGIVGYFSENAADAASELNFSNSYELLVAVMLSAQCTDKRVNLTTPALFSAYPDIPALAGAEVADVLPLVKSISYPNSKADHLVSMARKVVSDFSGEIPMDIPSLMTLPGVGRKTANVLTSIMAQAPVIAVDTHVFRVAHRIGLSSGKTPEKVEEDLERNIAPDIRHKAHHWLLLHGRYVCTARAPKCGDCPIRIFCAFSGNTRDKKVL